MPRRNSDGKFSNTPESGTGGDSRTGRQRQLDALTPWEPGKSANPLAGKGNWRIGMPWDPAWGPYPGGRPHGSSLSDLIKMALDEKVDVYYGDGRHERLERRQIWARHIVDMAVFGEIELPTKGPDEKPRKLKFNADSYAKHAIKTLRYLDPPQPELTNPSGITNIIFDIPVPVPREELPSQTQRVVLTLQDPEERDPED